jgi:hypothetical protein
MAFRNYPTTKTKSTGSTAWRGSSYKENNIIIQLWGAGGGGGTPGGWSFGAEGGGGGYVYVEIPTTKLSGQTLILQVGEGGLVNGSRMSFGGGGQANRTGSDNRYGSNGGGYTGLFLNSVSQANALAIAGGGGGGGSSRAGTGNYGGAGGGENGQDGNSPYDGKTGFRGTGGTQSTAGVCLSQANSYVARALEGGTAGTNGYGGAGGGGYYGGGAGGYSESNTMGGGGGGSGYTNLLYVSDFGNLQGNYKIPAGILEEGYPGSNIAYGGNVSSAGNHGFARITINNVVYTYSYTGSNVTISI